MATKKKKEVMGASKTIGRYQLGDCIGKGGFGSVYIALDMNTGGMVAIKQISVENIHGPELDSLMNEIDLMKKLKHLHIVKYIGFVKTKEHLNIILEYCENGSLQSICKKFGRFPETLMSVYTNQVLDGLIYLHDQGVIHRDIKGANILTTKEGHIKLADFGVATKASDIADNQVVGTPYWMAPEVIELNGVSTASDIWSVGCTIIELLTGDPPYSNLAPLSAMFRIVQDDHPPLPDGISESLEDFFLQCFQRDPKLRVSAAKLKKHKWIRTGVSAAQGEEVQQGRLTDFNEAVKTVQEWNEALDSSVKLPKNAHKMRSISLMDPPTRFDSVEMALKGMDDPKRGSALSSKPPPPRSSPKPSLSPKASPKAAPKASVSSPSSPLNAVKEEGKHRKQSDPMPIGAKQRASVPSTQPQGSLLSFTQVQKRYMEEEEENWDNDFSGEFKIGGSEGNTIVPKVPLAAKPAPKPAPTSRSNSFSREEGRPPRKGSRESAPRTQLRQDEDQDEEEGFGDEDEFEDASTIKALPQPRKLSFANEDDGARQKDKGKDKDRDALSDSEEEGSGSESLDESTVSFESENEQEEDWGKYFEDVSSKDLNLQKVTPKSSRSSSAKSTRSVNLDAYREDNEDDLSELVLTGQGISKLKISEERRRSGPDFSKSASGDLFAYKEKETEEDDYSDLFPSIRKGPSEPHLDLRRNSNGFWSEAVERDEEEDIFADLDVDLEDYDMEQMLIKDRRARALTESIKQIAEIKVDNSDENIIRICHDLLPILKEGDELRQELVKQHGVSPIIEMVEFCQFSHSFVAIKAVLHLLCEIVKHSEILESLRAIGAIPFFIQLSSNRSLPYDVRLEAASIIRQICHLGKEPIKMMIAARVIPVLVEFLDEEYDAHTQLVWIGIDCIESLFSIAKTQQEKVDFAHLLMKYGAANKLARNYHFINCDKSKESFVYLEKIASLFSALVSTDTSVRSQIANREVLKCLVKELDNLPPEHLLKMLKNIRSLSGDVNTLEGIEKASVIPTFLGFFERRHGQYAIEIHNCVMVILYDFCKISKKRQEAAVMAGVVPHLIHFSANQNATKNMAIEMLCDFAHSGDRSRKVLWQHDCLKFYIGQLRAPQSYVNVMAMEAIATWLSEEKEEVEKVISLPANIENIKFSFSVAQDGNLLDPLVKIVTLSEQVAMRLGEAPSFVNLLLERLSHRLAFIKLNLLRILRPILIANSAQKEVLRAKVLPVIKRLEENESAVMVQEMATKLKEML